jgi:hypothetical protein
MEKLYLISLLFLANLSFAQGYKKDKRMQVQKEDSHNKAKSDRVTTLDLIHALEWDGIHINKFDIGEFDQTYNIFIMADEYENGKIVKTDTLLAENNEYTFYEEGKEKYFHDYIDQIKVISKDSAHKSRLSVRIYSVEVFNNIALKKTDDRQFFNWRAYTDTKWKLNEKVPLMVFASSWEDKKYKFHRFCGVVNLAKDDKGTEELLSSSPNYIVISFKTTKENKK